MYFYGALRSLTKIFLSFEPEATSDPFHAILPILSECPSILSRGYYLCDIS